jgi:uncharacterized membrane protein
VAIFDAALLIATFLCSLVAGFLFAFAAVVMPGIGSMDDGGFIRAFQVIDRVIQKNQPLFTVVWAGSVGALGVATALGVQNVTGTDRLILIGAALIYVLGVQLPTVTINVPLNNQLQKIDSVTMTTASQSNVRDAFERRWNRWNVLRTACASLTSLALMLLLWRV